MNQRTLDKLKEHSHGNDTNHASQTGVISKNEEVFSKRPVNRIPRTVTEPLVIVGSIRR
jgi:hypothetical protein